MIGRRGEQMHVFRHEHERMQLRLAFETRRIDRSRQASSPFIVRQQGKPVVAGEGQLMKLTRFVYVSDSFAMNHE